MIYNDFQGMKLSALGFGGMRLPVIDMTEDRIDVAATETMVSKAIENGVNYFDTAWGYHGGHSEEILGKILNRYPRESWHLADKFPGYDLNNMDKVEAIFEKQLEKCGVEYFDFYLFHNVCEMNVDHYLNEEKYGILKYLQKQKAAGRIRHLGFSCHGSREVLERFLKANGEYMEFCQIQLNWLDWNFQGAREKVELLNAYNIPIWVMEPLRGGRLATLPEEDAAILHELRKDENIPAWAFRFLQTVPGVTVTLSGMSEMCQLEDNLHTCQQSRPLSEVEMKTLLGVAERMVKKITLPCTACRYCTSHCPQELDIPMLLEKYNEHCFTGGGFIAPMALRSMPAEKQPSACLGCRSCEAVCPQGIKISEAMADFADKMSKVTSFKAVRATDRK